MKNKNRIPRKTRITVVMEEDLKGEVERLAAENERYVSDFIRLVLKEYIEAMRGEPQAGPEST